MRSANMLLPSLALLAAIAAVEPPSPTIQTTEHRLYLAPGIQFGAFSQELSLGFGSAAVTTVDAPPEERTRQGGEWIARGIRLTGVAHSWAPAALHGVAYLSFGRWGWEWWPVGFEVALGGGGNARQRYGLVQLSYLVGISSRLELSATVQWPIGAEVGPPDGFSRGIFGFRYGFDLVEPRRERVSIQPLP